MHFCARSLHGDCVWGIFGCAGFVRTGPSTCTQLPPIRLTIRKTSIGTEHREQRIQAQIDASDGCNDSECIQDSVGREQERNTALEAVRAALGKGEISGNLQPFDPKAFKNRMLNTLK
ncbi:type II toxin-antitoxin system ParD family antitoxin [Pseudomonas retamae]|uniref:Type II toxin-antitoxin system ParD family antitoxin n=1 Tax=Pseudomonas retamae TaxID=702110 RepID=A0ABW7D891_9PSED